MDTPEQVAIRRSIFAKFNELKIIEEEKIRERELSRGGPGITVETRPSSWATPQIVEAWRQDQLRYVDPYRKEYESGQAKEKKEHSSALISRLASLRGRSRALGDTRISSSAQVNTRLVEDLDTISTIMPPTTVADIISESTADLKALRNKYFSGYRANTSLPIYRSRKNIINSIISYSVVIVQGSTGCGKTTQVPLYILENAILEKPNSLVPKIYVTQPRRIAARSIAERVCNEHNWTLGTLVGYQVGLEKVASPDSVLIFCTAGVLLQKIIQERSLKNYTHIIIDEAHERDADTDLLLMMIRKLMHEETSVFRLIVMSATIDTAKLKSYYTFRTNYGHQAVTSPSFVKVGENTSPNDVQIVYYNQLNHLFEIEEHQLEIDLDSPELIEVCLKTAVKIIVEVVPHLDNYTEESKSTLVFLPGLAEISRLDRMIRACPGAIDHLDIIPLHSCLAAEDQIRVFRPSKPGCRKVILATNIAESSITVTDIGFIIDFCLTKVLMKDLITRFPTLRLQWSTKDKCTQRAGRTGRCCPGKVFRLVPYNSYRDQFHEYAEPELLVAPLELSVLRVKNFNMGEICGLFAVVLDPPPMEEIRTAILELKQIGALAATYKGELTDTEGDLTTLGRVISSLPIDVHLSKLIVVANVFDVLEDAIIVAACLSTNRTIVKHMYQDPLESYDRKLDWANGSQSDLFVSLDVYYEFRECKTIKGKSDGWLATWCHKRALDERKLHDVDALVEEIKSRLANLNIACLDQPNRERRPDEDNLMLKVAICAAFYPNYFLTDKLDVERVRRELGGFDPARTVIFHQVPMNQAPLYKRTIEKPLKEIGLEDFDFISDNSRAVIVFRDNNMMYKDDCVSRAINTEGVLEQTRGIPESVYRALKLGESLELQVRLYHENAMHDRVVWYNRQRIAVQQEMGTKLCPSMTKVVERTPDNSRLLSSDESDSEIVVEVSFNPEQELADRRALDEYEQQLFRRQGAFIEDNHPIFKNALHRIRGPESPIRMMFRSVLVKSRGYSVDVDPNSINSILLDPDYKLDRRQMLVAATVAQNRRNRVLARDTTLMPNIRGLPTLMSLLFAQYYRLVYNEKMHCISGAIFGLGWDQNDEPLDRSYEVDLGFDVHINQNDIELINEARTRISNLLNTDVLNPGRPRAIIQQQLREIILQLLRKRRYPIQKLDLSTVYHPNLGEEGVFTKDRHNLPVDYAKPISESELETLPFLPLMENTRKYKEIELYNKIRQNLDQLQEIIDGSRLPEGGIKCLLCGNGQAQLDDGYKCLMIMHYHVIEHTENLRHQNLLHEFVEFEERALTRANSAVNDD